MNGIAFRAHHPRDRPAGDRSPEDRRRASLARIFAWATVIAIIVGALGLGQPVDDYMRMARNSLRMEKPSGQIVVLGIDERSVEALGAWPWPRRRHAEIVDKLHAAGVRKIVYDVFFNTRAVDRRDDDAFAAAIRRSGRVYLPVSTIDDRATGELRVKMPRKDLAKDAGLVSVALNYTTMAFVRELKFAWRYGEQVVPSMAAELADRHGPADKTFPLDYAIDMNAIRTISASTLLEGKVEPGALRGKSVVVAIASRDLGDIYYVPSAGLVNGGYINVIGGETLMRGAPTDVGWLAPFLMAWLLCAVFLFRRGKLLRRSAMTVAVFAGVGLPFFAEAHHIFYQTMPMLTVTAISGISGAWSNFRRSYKALGDINAVSGLPNLNALRGENAAPDVVLVVSRIRNFAEISSSLPIESERMLVDQIVARLDLGARGAQMYHGDEGLFAWASAPEASGADQLDALHALFRSPALVDGRTIDLSVTFGVDAIADRDFSNRLGSALVAADEAAAENLRWKAYDPARLADAEWKLSLLGRLDVAIDTGEIWVAYQPQLDVATGHITGAEALVRWTHPEKGAISPVDFVLAAEQHNRIDKLTEFVLSDAIKAAASFAAQGREFDVAVNVSARLLEKPGLIGTVRRLLDDARLAPDRLTLEVTESAAMTSGRASIRTLEEIGSLGINVSIDDYGTGFSTLEYFKKIPATEVKIDRSFVAAIDRNASDRLMVRSTIELAHSLGRIVVAEGVETPEVLSELSVLGCDKAQGYLIGKPVPLASLIRMIDERNRSAAA